MPWIFLAAGSANRWRLFFSGPAAPAGMAVRPPPNLPKRREAQLLRADSVGTIRSLDMVEGSLLEWSRERGLSVDSDRSGGSSARTAAIGVPPDIAAQRLELLQYGVGDNVVGFAGRRGSEDLRGLRRGGRGA